MLTVTMGSCYLALVFALWTLSAAAALRSVGNSRNLHASANSDYKTAFFTQPVDHFSFLSSQTFSQRYLFQDKYFTKEGNPIFFYTGNEGDIIWFYENTGLMLEWAADFGALVIFAEHRYYGKSLPFGDESFKDLNHVGYLSSEQALADFATLIDHIKQTVPGAQNSPVIAFGGSYGGMLAAWLRIKYPHSVIGALAASAPIWLFGDLVPCSRFSQIVTRDFDTSGPNCVSNIRRSWKVITDLGASDEGRTFLTDQLRLCTKLQSADDIEILKGWLAETYVNLAMVDYPYEASFLEPLPAWPIKVVCSHLADGSLTDVELISHLHDAVNVYYNFTGKSKCFNVNETAVASLSDQGWSFQSCTEMVMPGCSDGVGDMFEPHPWNLTAFSLQCQKDWKVTPRPRWIIEEYGGKNIAASSNIIFSNGDLDPWSAGGVLQSLSQSLLAVVIKDAAHHLDLRSSRPDDIPSLVEARSREKSIVSHWLDQHQQYQLQIVPSWDLSAGADVKLVGFTPDVARCNLEFVTESPATSALDEFIVFIVIAAVFVVVLIFVGYSGKHRGNLPDIDPDPEFSLM